MSAANERIRISARVEPAQDGMRLDQAAARLFPDYSRARLQRWIADGSLTVDGQSLKPTHRVSPGELLSLDALLEHESEVQPEDIPLDLVHADPDLLVLNKPAGLVVHPAAGNPAGTLQNALLHFDPGLAALPRAGIVHRLDKDTSGIMVVARSLRAHSSLVDQLQRRRMGRIYRAVAAGDLTSGGRIEAAIGRHPRDRKRMAVVPGGKHAVSHFRVLKRFGLASYIEVSLETGRTHQIRVHMAHIGHPLVGDSVYGRPPRSARGADRALLAGLREFPRQALHATTLALEHPGSGEAVEFTAPMPSDMRGLLALLDQVGR